MGSLDSLRYNLFSKKIVTTKSFVKPERLPPTDSSTKYHYQRFYFQIMVWIGKEGDSGLGMETAGQPVPASYDQ